MNTTTEIDPGTRCAAEPRTGRDIDEKLSDRAASVWPGAAVVRTPTSGWWLLTPHNYPIYMGVDYAAARHKLGDLIHMATKPRVPMYRPV